MANGRTAQSSSVRHQREFSRYRRRIHDSIQAWLNWDSIENARPDSERKRLEQDYIAQVDESLRSYYRSLRLGHRAAYDAFHEHVTCRDAEAEAELEQKIEAYREAAEAAYPVIQFLLSFDWTGHVADVVLKNLRKVAFSDDGTPRVDPTDMKRVVAWLRNLSGFTKPTTLAGCVIDEGEGLVPWQATGDGFAMASPSVHSSLQSWLDASESLASAYGDTHYSIGDLAFLDISANGWGLEKTVEEMGSDAAAWAIVNAMNWIDDYLGFEPVEPRNHLAGDVPAIAMPRGTRWQQSNLLDSGQCDGADGARQLCDDAEAAKSDERRERTNQRRDELWLAWNTVEGLTNAMIRDRWNSMPLNERQDVCDAAQKVSSGTVKSALRRLRDRV
ncbi:MAG: hypothetical protein RIC55_36205 [Pirellulaceae bacterium]